MIRLMKEQDKNEVIEMMTVFYASEAVSTNGSREIFESDFNNCINSLRYYYIMVVIDNFYRIIINCILITVLIPALI